MDWFLYNNGLRHERVKIIIQIIIVVGLSYKPSKSLQSIVSKDPNMFLFGTLLLRKIPSLTNDILIALFKTIFVTFGNVNKAKSR